MCLMWRRFISPSSFLSQPSYIYQLLLLMHRFREHWSQKMNNKDPSSVIPAYLLKTSYDFLFKRSIQSSETEGQIFTMCGSAWTFRTALATAGARSRGHSLPSGGYHTNSSCGKKWFYPSRFVPVCCIPWT